jgi:organic radical activating enzyme
MKKKDLLKAWLRILQGSYPTLSIEITRECPLRCPGCYAYDPGHLQDLGPLRSLSDFKGQELIDRVLSLVRQYRPVHVSIVGGEPLVRFRELEILLPKLSAMGINVQLVTSAVREIPKSWNKIEGLTIAVSIDGLQPEHDLRRAPATYQKILQNIVGHSIIVHTTVTAQTASRPNYYEEFLAFWSERPEVKKIWVSLFTPQRGADLEEILLPSIRAGVLDDLAVLRTRYPKLEMPDQVLEGYRTPPRTPQDCIFSRTTINYTADLKSKITPCQFGGDPDCSQCGCMASAGLNAVGDYRVGGVVSLRGIMNFTDRIGKRFGKRLQVIEGFEQGEA